MKKWILELLGDALIIALGILLVFIFVTIEIFHIYGVEANAIMRRTEMIGGVPIIIFGVYHLIKDIGAKGG